MTTSTFFRALTGALVLALVTLVIPACNKPKSTKAIITVKKDDGTVVADAYVKLYANPQQPLADPHRLDMEKHTDAAGKAEFDYSDFYKKGQSGFAVLDILCTSDTLVGEGIIKIEEEKTNEQTIVIIPAQ